MENQPSFLRRLKPWQLLFIAAGIVLAATWLVYTPPGLLGKADALGYSVCHRIESHSFSLGGRQLPLCARCTGMFLGALLGLLYQTRAGKAGNLPPARFLAFFGLLAAAFVFDGANSAFEVAFGRTGLYAPNNTLRLITGSGMGLGIATLLYPIINEVFFKDVEYRPAIASWRDVGLMLLAAAGMDLLVLSGAGFLLYPLGVLSGLAVWTLLGICYTLIWTILLRREGIYTRLSSGGWLAAAGFATALLQVGVIDLARFAWTGTWGGLPL